MSSPCRRPHAPGDALVGTRADGAARLVRADMPGHTAVANPRHAPDGRAPEGGPEVTPGLPGAPEPGAEAEAMDRISHHLCLAGFRLASLRRRLDDSDDRLTLTEASDELDEAIAEIRRLALIVRYGVGD